MACSGDAGTFGSLPFELLLNVLNHLDDEMLGVVAQLSQLLRSASSDA